MSSDLIKKISLQQQNKTTISPIAKITEEKTLIPEKKKQKQQKL